MNALAPSRVVRRGAVRALWTGPHVAQTTISAFRVLPSWPVYSRKFGEFSAEGLTDRLAPGPHKVFRWAELYCEHRERVVLFQWASCKAKAPVAAEGSLREWSVEFFPDLSPGSAWVRFQRIRERAAEKIAEGLNRDSIPIFWL